MKKIKIPKKIRQFFKKLTTLETYEDLLVAFLKFFIKRNPASPIYALTKIISPKLNFGVPRSSTSEKTFSKTFSEHCQYFSFHHPYISAGTSFVLILTLIFSSLIFLFFKKSQPVAAWWDDTWGYRKQVEISNSAGSDVENQYVKITLDTATLISEGKMQADCDDIRVADRNGNLLKFFVDGDADYTCNDTDTSVYAMAENIPSSGTDVYVYYGKPSAENGEIKLGSSQNPALSCKNILEHRSDSEGDGNYYITPSGKLADKIEVGCDMDSNGGGWINVFHGLPSEAMVLNTTNESIKLSNDIVFNDIRMEGVNLDFDVSTTAVETAKLSKTIPQYYYEVDQQPDGDSPRVNFHDLDGNQDVLLTSNYFLFGYGNSWRVFYTCINVSSIDNLYLGGYSPTCTPRSSFVSTDVGCSGGGDHYCGNARTTTPKDSGLGLSLYEYQETKVWVRESDIVMLNDLDVNSLGSEEKSKGPVGYWSFDEGYGTTANDGSGKGNDGTITGATWQTEDQCVVGKCLRFDGVDDLVDHQNFSINSDESWSFSMWQYKPSSTSEASWQAFIGSNIGVSGGYWMWHTSGKLLWYQDYYDDGGGSEYYGYQDSEVNLGEEVPFDKWFHLSIVYSGDSQEINVYLNGKSIETKVATWSPRPVSGATFDKIGGSNSRYFNGSIDEVKIYSYARTEEEIQQDYNAGLAAMSTPKGSSVAIGSESPAWMSEGLVGYWKMDEASYDLENNQILDASGNQNHAEGVNLNLVNDRLGRGNSAIKLETNQENLLMDYMTWKDGQTGGIGDFNGYSTGNSRVFGEDPWGRDVVVWQSGESGNATYPALGGIYHDSMPIDNTKLYRMSWWEKRVTNAEATYGRYYAGLNGYGSTNGVINLSSGTYNTNPYFWYTNHDNLTEDEWFLVVGHVFPYDHTGTTRHSDSGRYTVGGFLGNTNVDYKWAPETTTARSRTLAIYLGTDENMIHHTVYPRMDVVDGTEPSIQDLLDGHDKYGDNIEIEITQEKESYVFWYDHNSDGSWEHVVNSSGTYYVNGELGTPTKDPIYISGNNVYVGREDMETYLDGTISDLRVYNRTLTPEEVKGLYEYAPGPVGYWKIDEGSGTSVYDSSGNDLSGSFVDTPLWRQGKYGSSLYFDGNNDRVSISHDKLLEPKSITVGFWAKLQSDGTRHVLVTKWGGFTTEVNSDGTFKWGLNGLSDQYFGTEKINWDEWVYLTGTYNDETKEQCNYINGIKTECQTTTGNINYSQATLYFSWGAETYGQIDDVKIYNYARTEKQIMEDMLGSDKATSGGDKNSGEGSQVAYWKFDEGYGTTAYDSVGDNDGTITGASWTNDGKFGKALSFDGADDRVTSNETFDFNLNADDWTASVWMYVDRDGYPGHNWTNILGIGTSYTLGFSIEETRALFYDDVNKSGYAINFPQPYRKWMHVAFQHIRDERKIIVYLDGEYHDEEIYANNGELPNTISRKIEMGYSTITDRYFKGKADEVKIYNYALTEDEIKKDYNQGKGLVMGGPGETPSGLTGQAAEYCVPGDTATCNPPVAEWKFDEKEGSTAYDTSGNGNNGILNGGPTWSRGKYGSAVEFDGDNNNDYVEVNDFSVTDNPYTFEAWLKPIFQMGGDDECVVGKNRGSGTGNSYGLGIKLQDNYVYGIAAQSNSEWRDNLRYDISEYENEWIHVAFAIGGVSGVQTGRLFINGKLVKEHTGTAGYYSEYPFLIGNGKSSVYEGEFKGRIDDVKIYDYARTPAQIAWDYNRGKPIAHWKMDEGEGSTVYDWSGNGNHGIMQNMSVDDWVDGKNNGALDFDGGDDYVEINNLIQLNQGGITVSSWFKLDNLGWSQAIIRKNGRSGNYYDFVMRIHESTNKIRWGVNKTTGYVSGDNARETNLIPEIGKWYNVIGTWDGVNEPLIYVNGDLVSTIGGATSGTSSEENLWLGGTGTSSVDGIVDDIQIYNYALTAEQIKQIYNGGAINYK